MSGAHKSPGFVPSAVVTHAGTAVKMLPTLLHVVRFVELRMFSVPPVPKRKYLVPSHVIEGSATPMPTWVVVVGVGPPPNGLVHVMAASMDASTGAASLPAPLSVA